MIGTGVRVSEVINIRSKDIQLGTPSLVVVTGKGGISRQVPIQKALKEKLKNYLSYTGFDHPARRDEYIFKNQYGNHLSRHAVYNLVNKYAALTRKRHLGLIPEVIYPHVLRHTFATLNVE